MFKNMKKALLFLVALMLMVTFGAQALTLDLEYEGVSMTLPEDFIVALEDDGDTVSIHMYTAESLDNALFIIGVSAADEVTADVQADLLKVYEEIADDLHEAAYEFEDFGEYTFLVVTEGTAAEVIYLTQAHGNLVQITCIASNGAGLTQAQTDAVISIVSSLNVKEVPAE